MITKEKVLSLIQDVLDEKDIYIVSLTISTSNSIKLFVDSMQGVKIEDCVQLSRAIEHNLDRDNEDFDLEVSSAGLDMPFTVKQQYFKNLGKEIEVNNTSGVKNKGVLLHADDNEFSIEQQKKVKIEGKKKKQTVTETLRFNYNDVNKVKLIIKF